MKPRLAIPSLTYSTPPDLREDPVVIRDSPRQMLLYLAAGIGALLYAMVGHHLGWDLTSQGWGIIGAAIMIPFSTWCLIRRKPRLIVDSSGVTDCLTGLGFIPYEQIVRVWSTSFMTNAVLVIRL